jgi:hypothetical protein
MTTRPNKAMRLVPVEPTSAMIQEGLATYHSDGRDDMETIRLIYAAMLAAAPASPLPEGGGDELTSAREVLDLIESNPVLVSLKGRVSDSLLIEAGYAMVAFIKSLPAAPTGEAK